MRVFILASAVAGLFFTDLFLPSSLIGSQSNKLDAQPHGPIPHILWFTYKHDILQTREPRHYYDNVMKTIHAYRTEWNESNAPVNFLTDKNCTQLLQEVDAKEQTTLADAFQNEKRGDLKADLCRLAALFLHGGYYFDVDLEVVKPIRIDPKVSFCTVRDTLRGFFFQAFLAVTPRHPVLKQNLKTVMEFYVKQRGYCWKRAKHLVGPCTLMKAWKQTSKRGKTRLLKETHLQHEGLYPNMTQRGLGDGCHWVVHDPKLREVYFYSRILGSEHCTE